VETNSLGYTGAQSIFVKCKDNARHEKGKTDLSIFYFESLPICNRLFKKQHKQSPNLPSSPSFPISSEISRRRWGEEPHSVRHSFHLHQTSICKN